MLVRGFTRSELAVHWTLAASLLLMVLSGIALGVTPVTAAGSHGRPGACSAAAIRRPSAASTPARS